MDLKRSPSDTEQYSTEYLHVPISVGVTAANERARPENENRTYSMKMEGNNGQSKLYELLSEY